MLVDILMLQIVARNGDDGLMLQKVHGGDGGAQLLRDGCQKHLGSGYFGQTTETKTREQKRKNGGRRAKSKKKSMCVCALARGCE